MIDQISKQKRGSGFFLYRKPRLSKQRLLWTAGQAERSASVSDRALLLWLRKCAATEGGEGWGGLQKAVTSVCFSSTSFFRITCHLSNIFHRQTLWLIHFQSMLWWCCLSVFVLPDSTVLCFTQLSDLSSSGSVSLLPHRPENSRHVNVDVLHNIKIIKWAPWFWLDSYHTVIVIISRS